MEENTLVVIVCKLLVQKKLLKCHINDWFQINGRQIIEMPQEVNMLNSKIMKKSKITICDLCRFWKYSSNKGKSRWILNKDQKHVACSYGLKLVSVDDKFSKSFKSCLGEDFAYNFINSMIEEVKY